VAQLSTLGHIRAMKITRFIFLLAAFVLVGGCAKPKPAPDPLVGWQGDFNEQPNQTIVSDYQDYIQKLPPTEKPYSGVNDWLKDGTGQHAIVIEVALNGTWWNHVLIYNKDDKRIKTIKYSPGHYRS
jgi:hypothetical protein